jgi:hypothetical protein
LRGRENVAKRYLIQVAAYNLGLVMRTLLGAGAPRAAADLRLLWLGAGDRLLLALLVGSPIAPAILAIVTVTPDHPPFSTGCCRGSERRRRCETIHRSRRLAGAGPRSPTGRGRAARTGPAALSAP